MALSLEPHALLLDEMSSALDDATTMRVERTLEGLGIPLVLVTHDQSQLRRFCNRSIELPSTNMGAIASTD